MAIDLRHTPLQQDAMILRAVQLDTMAQTDAALDLLYDGFDELMRQGRFTELNTVLSSVRADYCSADLLLGMLTASLPGRSRLPARAVLLQETETVLRRRGEYAEGLLSGL